jgi:tRNA (cytidine/uridine-2'-O-)-methyltransferase
MSVRGEGPCDLHIVLVSPEIHWNTGNAGRTCLALGARLHLVEPLGFSLEEKQVRRAGLDYWPRVDLRVWRSWAELEVGLPALGPAYFFAAGADRGLWQVAFPRPCVLIFGCESTGLPADVLVSAAGRAVSIPMARDTVRSLNLSTAVAVAAFEVVRQWQPGVVSG